MDLEGVESSEETHFFYDAQSRPAFVEYEGKTYCYIHNLQGDIVGILDDSGSLVVEYKYDAWGKPFSITGTLKTSLRELNPFRYRNYIFDFETQLYYLRERYYNIGIGRFISEDSLISSSGFGEMNVFSYCVNDPINASDPNGQRYIDALSVQNETTEQRKQAFAYTKSTKPQKANKKAIKLVDNYFTVCNQEGYRKFRRLSDVYMYANGEDIYLKTTYGGYHYTRRFQRLPKYEVRYITFKINTYESVSKSDVLSFSLFFISGTASHMNENCSAMGLDTQAQVFECIQATSDVIDEFFSPSESWSDPIFTDYFLTVQNQYTLY